MAGESIEIEGLDPLECRVEVPHFLFGMQGMDPEAVRQLAQEIQRAAQHLETLVHTLNANVTNTAWTGRDRDQFVAHWDSTLRPHVLHAACGLAEAASAAQRNAEQQEQVSNS